MIDFYTDLETEEVRYEPRDIRWNLNHRILTREEIQELLVLNQSGDQDARDQLVECNMQLIWSFAKRYGAEHNLIDELMADGVIAFLQSADKYDLEQYKIESYHKTHPFIGYASTNIDRAIRNSNQLDDLVALPDYLKRLKGRVAKARYELLTEDIQNPTNNQIADYIIEHLNDSKYRYSKDQVLKYLEGFHKRDIIGLRNHVLSDSNLLYEDIIGVEDPSFRFIEERDYFDHILEYLDLDEKRIFCHSVVVKGYSLSDLELVIPEWLFDSIITDSDDQIQLLKMDDLGKTLEVPLLKSSIIRKRTKIFNKIQKIYKQGEL